MQIVPRRQFAWNVKTLFSWKYKENIPNLSSVDFAESGSGVGDQGYIILYYNFKVKIVFTCICR